MLTNKKQINNVATVEKLHLINANHNYRYERKFTVPDTYSIKKIEQVVKRNSYLFRPIFHKRQVNNIYFDSIGMNDYHDNVLGVSNRKKIRIRWYGDTFGNIKKPVLEIKIKKGLVGDKWSYKLNPFVLDNNFTNEYIQDIIKASNVPLPIKEGVKMVSPTLLNSYSRTYFLSADNKFRITLDFDLLYHKIGKRFNNFNIKPVSDKNKIVELKYGLNDDVESVAVSTQFSFRLNKNSKYVNGVDAFTNYTQ
jgi:SPX domain protein involved in polyphosphate accumulation